MTRAWSKLHPILKLDQLAETIIKTAFMMSEDHIVVTSYVEHKGANFRVANQKRVEEFEVLCRQICIDKTIWRKSWAVRKDVWAFRTT